MFSFFFFLRCPRTGAQQLFGAAKLAVIIIILVLVLFVSKFGDAHEMCMKALLLLLF